MFLRQPTLPLFIARRLESNLGDINMKLEAMGVEMNMEFVLLMGESLEIGAF